MTRFYFALVLLVLMALQQLVVAALGANGTVGFTLSPFAVFVLIILSPFLMIVANGLPSLYSLLPQAASEGPLPAIAVNKAGLSTADVDQVAGSIGAVVLKALREAEAVAPRPVPRASAEPVITSPVGISPTA